MLYLNDLFQNKIIKFVECFKIIKSKLNIKSFYFVLFTTIYFGLILNLSFFRFIFQKIDVNSSGIFLFFLSLLLFLMISLYLFFNLILVPYFAKPVLIILLLISSTTNYLMFNYGVFIDSDMIRNVFETNQREAMDLITWSGFFWVFITGIIPSVLIAFSNIIYSSLKVELKQRIISVICSLLVFGFFAIVSFKECASFIRNNRQIRKLINTFNYIYSTAKYFQIQTLANKEFIILDKDAEHAPYEDPYPTVFILIIGETARASNFSLNGYKRDTNPLLSKQDIINFKDTKSCGTSTAISVPCIFSNKVRKDFDVNTNKYTENILDVLQRVGYDVIWKENDDGCKNVCNRIKSINLQQSKSKFCKKDYCYDEVLLENLEEEIKNIKKDTLIVLHTMGSHGPTYFKRYPDKFRKFVPTCDTANISVCSKDEIINTYDNTILYTDYIVSSAIDIIKKFPNIKSGLLYVSDHGESLGENNIYLHGLPYKIAPDEQKNVPMILWMSDSMKKYNYIDYKCLKMEANIKSYSHDNLFHSLNSLFLVNSKIYDEKYDIFKECRIKDLFFN